MKEVIEKIKAAKSVAVLTHISEDPDALGSAFAFCAIMRKLGKSAVCYVSAKPQERHMFIGGDYVIYDKKKTYDHDLCMCLDCGDIKRIGDRIKLFDEIGNTANIDHHKTNTMFADANYAEGETSSTGEILFKVFREMGAEIDDEIARFLYIAICSDTGCFKYSSVTPDTLKIAAELLGYNFDAAEVARLLFDTDSLSVTKFKAELMSNIESYAGGKISLVKMTADMYDKYGIPESEAPNGVEIPRRIEGTEIAVCVKEKNGRIEISMRSNGRADVSEIAENFGGGGHRAAAGCKLTGKTMDEAAKEIIAACEKAAAKL